MTKRIIVSLTMIALVVAGVTSATVAYLSDTATITGSTFSAGTLDLKIDANPSSSIYQWENGFAAPVNFLTNMKPGDTDDQIIDIMSVGTVGGNATIDLNRTSAWSDLAGVLNFRVYYDGDHNGSFQDTGLNGTVDQFTGPYTLGPINSSDSMASVKIVWSVPASAGNEIQGDSVTIDTVFGLEQKH